MISMTVTTVELKLTRQYESEIPPTPPQIQARVSTLLRIGLLQGLPFLTVACEEEKILRSSVREKYSLNPLILRSTFNPITTNKSTVIAGLAPEGSQYDSHQYHNKMNELLSEEGKDFFTSYDEVFDDTFDKMGLTENLLRGIYMPMVLRSHQQFNKEELSPFAKALMIAMPGSGACAPSRELAQQIEKVMRALGEYLGVKVHACVGGTSVREDQTILAAGVHVVVGTLVVYLICFAGSPFRADNIRMFVLDEADEMLSRGFKDQIYDIFQLLPEKIQVDRCVFCNYAPRSSGDHKEIYEQTSKNSCEA
ncbi:hypothetical protein SLEP1_g15915 [Rubroshorea leprosula]|uniref:ATP-dependent RNA helicase n=1 Tax=Rubroshorea leprosula TaxID=152421 RepID=A0AAV5IY45_9ROSI|nr:hypothetical protein SLEP1_g15915 [Rubroshorea leprosula]